MIEISNIVINSIIGSISNFTHKNVRFNIPEYSEQLFVPLRKHIDSKDQFLYLISNTKLSIPMLDIETSVLVSFDFKSYNYLDSFIRDVINY